MGKYLSLDRDIIFLEIILIALSIFHWHKLFYKKKIIYYIDNMAVLALAVAKYRRLLNARPAGNVQVQKAKLSHNDCNCFKVFLDITFLEIILSALSIFLWHKLFYKKKIIYYIDNMAVVSVLNSKTSTSSIKF
jgi:hypothetical protein